MTWSTPLWPIRRRFLLNAGVVAISLVGVVVLSECLFGFLNYLRQDIVQHNWAGLNEPDSVLAYRGKPNASLKDVAYRNGKRLYSAVYTTNAFGRRNTPMDHPTQRHKFLALFGCSCTYGLCLNDDQTLGACLAQQAPGYAPYNFAYQGYGTQQMMLLLEQPIQNEIPQKEGVGLYLFNLGHVPRVIGSMQVVTNWGWDFPSYRLEGDTLVREGTFKTAHPWRQALYSVLGKSQCLKYFHIDFPIRFRPAHFQLVARMIRRSSELFRQKWPGSEFYVVVGAGEFNTWAFDHIAPYLDLHGIKYIRCPDVFDGKLAREDWEIAEHPTAMANKILAERLVHELKLAEPTTVGRMNDTGKVP